MVDDHQTTIREMQATWETQKQSFEDAKQVLIEDHQSSLAKFQELVDKEREDTAATHAQEITALKEQITTLTASYDEKLALAGKTLAETVEAHKLALETLTTEKDGLIASEKESKAARETELQEEITNLTAAVNKAQDQMMVYTLPPISCLGIVTDVLDYSRGSR
jgi:hypothetical protein